MQATKYYVRPRLLAIAIASILFLSSYALIEISSWTGGIAESFYYDQQQRRLSSDVPTNNAVPGMPEPMSPGRLRRDKFLEARVNNAREAWRRQRKLTETETETEEDIWLRPNVEDHAALKEEHERRIINFMQSSNQLTTTTTDDHQVPSSFSVCGRPTGVGTLKDLALLQNFNDRDGGGKNCPGANSNDVLIIQGLSTFGRTGNNLIEFLHALQYGRDNDVKVGIKYDSWVIPLIQDMWMSRDIDESVTDWEARFEKAFCVKIFHQLDEWEGYNIVGREWGSIEDSHTFTRELFMYTSEAPLHDYVGHQAQHLQALFQHANTGQGLNLLGQPVQDMCSGLNAVFGTNAKSSVIYTAIHQRHLEGAPGKRLLWKVAQKSGCDSAAALNMEPEYVKSILRPIGMLHHHIVLIADGEDPAVIERLKADREIGKKLRVVPPEASWVGGDITLAIMANVFIGNPASSFSGFIAKSRVALGLGHNYLFRAKSADGKWYTSCGGTCIFDHNIMGVMI